MAQQHLDKWCRTMTEPGFDARPQVPATTHPPACLLGQVSFLQSGHQGILISRSRADQMRYLRIYLGMELLCQMVTCTFDFGETPNYFPQWLNQCTLPLVTPWCLPLKWFCYVASNGYIFAITVIFEKSLYHSLFSFSFLCSSTDAFGAPTVGPT